MDYEKMTGLELLNIYEKYVHDFKIDPNAPKEAKQAFNEAMKRGQYKKELWEKKRILLG